MIAAQLKIGQTTVSRIGARAGVKSQYKGGCFLTDAQLDALRRTAVLNRRSVLSFSRKVKR